MNRNNSIEEIFSFLKKCKKVVMSLHYMPDGDSLGSCTALKYILERDFGIKVFIIGKDELDTSLREHKFAKEVSFGKGIDEINLEEFDSVICLDSGDIKQFASVDFKSPIPLVIIDHHATNNYFGNLNYIDVKKTSCCSVLLDIFKKLKVKIDGELATRLLMGIYTDSGFFAHDNGASLLDAAYLVEKGADYFNSIVKPIRFNVPLKMMKYYALLVERFKTIKMECITVGYSITSDEDVIKLGLNMSDVRGGINYLKEIGGVDIFFTLADKEEFIKGSFRSTDIDISLFAQALGGGGHKRAAAFKIEKMPLEDAEKLVLETIKKIGVHKIAEK